MDKYVNFIGYIKLKIMERTTSFKSSRQSIHLISNKIPKYFFLFVLSISLLSCGAIIRDVRDNARENKNQKAYNESVSHVQKLISEADRYIKAKRYQEATEKYTEAIQYFTFKGGTAHVANKRNEHYALMNKLYNLRGWSYYFAGSEQLALKDFFKVSDALPEAALAAAKVSYAMYAEKKPNSSYSTMQIAYKKAIKHYPEKKELYYEKAAATYNLYYNKSGRGIGNKRDPKLKEAFYEITKATRLDPQYQKAYKLKSLLGLVTGGNTMQITGDADKAIKLNPRDADAMFVRGYAAKLMGERLEAIEYAEKAIALEPKNQKYRNALVDWKKKEVKSATKDDWIAAFLGLMIITAITDDGQNSSNQSNSNKYEYDFYGPGGAHEVYLDAIQNIKN